MATLLRDGGGGGGGGGAAACEGGLASHSGEATQSMTRQQRCDEHGQPEARSRKQPSALAGVTPQVAGWAAVILAVTSLLLQLEHGWQLCESSHHRPAPQLSCRQQPSVCQDSNVHSLRAE